MIKQLLITLGVGIAGMLVIGIVFGAIALVAFILSVIPHVLATILVLLVLAFAIGAFLRFVMLLG